MVRAAASVFLAGILSQLSPGSIAALSPAARPGLRDARAVFIQTAPAPGARCAKVWVGREPELEEYLRQARIGRIEAVPVGVTKPKRAFFEPGGPVASAAWTSEGLATMR